MLKNAFKMLFNNAFNIKKKRLKLYLKKLLRFYIKNAFNILL